MNRPNSFLARFALALLLSALAALAVSCATQLKFRYRDDRKLAGLIQGYVPVYPAASFAVMSDVHFQDPALGVTGKAFDDYINQDRKLIKESRELAETAFGLVAQEPVDFVLIPGDLTKDGEYENHRAVAALCASLRAGGKKAFVVPGNHDVRNGWSYRYEGDGRERTRNVTSAEFADIYAGCGYADALSRDPGSLSYVAEPVTGLWLVALDACLSAGNKENGEPATAGAFDAGRLAWLENVLERSVVERKAVIAMMHHGALEHFPSQVKYFPEYVVKDYEQISRLLADYKVRVVFTGHFHAQDIACARWDDRTFLFDIETGSLVSYPCPYRVVAVSGGNAMSIASRRIQALPSRPAGFQKFAEEFLASGISGIAVKTMKDLGVPESDFGVLAPQIAEAFVAHYAGDERLPPGREALKLTGLSFMGSLVVGNRKSLVEGLWNDSPCPDNDVTLDLATGTWR